MGSFYIYVPFESCLLVEKVFATLNEINKYACTGVYKTMKKEHNVKFKYR